MTPQTGKYAFAFDSNLDVQPLLSGDVEFFELRKDWRELAKALFVKGITWESENEVRLLVDLRHTRPLYERDENGFVKHVVDVPTEAKLRGLRRGRLH